MAEEKDWTAVLAGDVVLGKDNRPWSVMERTPDGWARLENEAGKSHDGHPEGMVVVLQSSEAEAERAMALVQVRLGGDLVAERDDKDRQGRWIVPADFPDLRSMLAHVYVFHGLTASEKTTGAALLLHEKLHSPQGKRDSGAAYEDHVHDPDFQKRRLGIVP